MSISRAKGLMCISLRITQTKTHVYRHTINSLLSHSFNTTTLQVNAQQFYILWDFNILVTPIDRTSAETQWSISQTAECLLRGTDRVLI